MKISILQPRIERGNTYFNYQAIQRLIDESKGELLVLPEYALTGSLVLDKDANINKWADESIKVKEKIKIPEGKKLLINSLIKREDKIYNCSELLPAIEYQCKLFPDKTELEYGVAQGDAEHLFELDELKFKTIICTDLRHIEKFNTDDLDFLLFIFHFTDNNFEEAMGAVRSVSSSKGLPVLVSSLISDKNIGFSSYVNNNTVVSLPNYEGILEIEI